MVDGGSSSRAARVSLTLTGVDTGSRQPAQVAEQEGVRRLPSKPASTHASAVVRRTSINRRGARTSQAKCSCSGSQGPRVRGRVQGAHEGQQAVPPAVP